MRHLLRSAKHFDLLLPKLLVVKRIIKAGKSALITYINGFWAYSRTLLRFGLFLYQFDRKTISLYSLLHKTEYHLLQHYLQTVPSSNLIDKSRSTATINTFE